MKRPNLKVTSYALADELVLDGRRATGVGSSREPDARPSRARREVILSTGAVALAAAAPALRAAARRSELQARRLCRRDLPGVGENLQDHLQIRPVFKV